MNQFEKEWQTWAALCLHPDIKPQSRGSLEVAFYSGAMTWARLISGIMSRHDYIDAMVLLDDLHNEIGDYADKLRAAVGNGRPKEYEQ